MKAFIRPKTLLCLAAVGTVTTAVLLAEPSWWVARGARDPALPASDYAALNQGQLKNLARAARDAAFHRAGVDAATLGTYRNVS